MVFGILLDVPIVVGGYLFMAVYRRQLAAKLARVPLPLLATSVLLSVPLIIVEEQIDCMPQWCGQVLIPPTLPFIILEIFVVCLIALRFQVKSAFRLGAVYNLFGVAWEILLGGLVGASPVILAFFGPYVWLSYGYVSLLPLSIIVEGKRLRTVKSPALIVAPPVS